MRPNIKPIARRVLIQGPLKRMVSVGNSCIEIQVREGSLWRPVAQVESYSAALMLYNMGGTKP